jgi:DNA-directed RNA polymerase specialized sigma24 family protein
MDHEQLVRRASAGDVSAFVDLTRRFQHFAFGSALALVRDCQQAEDIVQEAFVAAWTALPTLAEPAAFPGWLRGIVRHHAFRVLRRKQLHAVPLAEAENVSSDDPPAMTYSSSDGRPRQRWPRFQSCRIHCANRRRCSSSTNARIRTSPLSLGCRR